MEKRTLIAIILSITILIVWSFFFQPKPVPEKIKEEKQEQLQTPGETEKEKIQPLLQVHEGPETEIGKDVIVEADLYKAVFSTRGAIIKSWQLKNYKDKDGMPVALLREPGSIHPLGILFEGANRDFLQKVIYTVNKDKLILTDKGDASGELVFTYSNQGISITKKLVFYNDLYKINITIETPDMPSYLLPVGSDFGVFNKDQREHKGPVILIESDRKEFDEKLKGDIYLTGNIRWVAQEDKYFAAAIIPVTQIEGASVWKEGDFAEIALKQGFEKNEFVLYAGPKEYDRLKQLGMGLEHIIDFGWFSIVAMPLFWVLKFFYRFLGNYGWAIIILTIIVRIPFIPLMHKSQQSMKKMQDIQPMMTAIKEKYKKDPQKMQKEMTGLYKKHKVNPVGGCLPMLLQIPVFIALYNVLLKAIELRGAPFMLWIKDLSAKDPYYVLPIVMGISMVLQQKMTPSAMDPRQAKMMMLMPIVFTFLFLTFPSGLVLYWLVNNILAIIQQYYANKKVESEK